MGSSPHVVAGFNFFQFICECLDTLTIADCYCRTLLLEFLPMLFIPPYRTTMTWTADNVHIKHLSKSSQITIRCCCCLTPFLAYTKPHRTWSRNRYIRVHCSFLFRQSHLVCWRARCKPPIYWTSGYYYRVTLVLSALKTDALLIEPARAVISLIYRPTSSDTHKIA